MFVIDAASAVPPYEQLRLQVAARIRDRSLAVGARLPTIRGLAGELGLAVNTVARTYRELEDAGLIETRGRAGSFVTAAGQGALERVRRAAVAYAAVVAAAGIDAAEGLRIAEAALNTASGPTLSPPSRPALDAPS